MSLEINSDFSMTECSYSLSRVFFGFATAAAVTAIFYTAMNALENYRDPLQNYEDINSYENSGDYDDDRTYKHIVVPRDTTQVLPTENSSYISSFITENVTKAETIIAEETEEPKEEPELVIGAEDLVDHFNRMIG